MAAAELAFGVFFVAGAHGGLFRFDFRACRGFRFGCLRCSCRWCCRRRWRRGGWRGWGWGLWGWGGALEILELRQSFESLLVIPYLNATSNSVAAEYFSAGAAFLRHRC